MHAFEFCGPLFAAWLKEQNEANRSASRRSSRDEQILPSREQRDLDALPSGLDRERET
jgi:hypothetical protein